MSEENLDASLNINPWDPKIGDRVTHPMGRFGGQVIGLQPPGMEGPSQTRWRVLVKWNDTSREDSWHDVVDLEFDDAPPLPCNGV